MEKTQIITLVLSSAAIGALVSSTITLLGQWRERKSRRDELVLTEAIRLGEINMQVHTDIAKARAAANMETKIVPLIEMVTEYHKWLRNLLDKGQMPADYVPTSKRSQKDQ